MNTDYIVRLVKKDELAQLLQLYRHFNNGDPEIKKVETLQELWNEIYNDPSLHYIVAEINGLFVSTCTIAIIKNLTRELRPYGLIENVLTHSDYRNLGFGKAVLKKAIEIAEETNCYKVMLLTGSKKEETLNFYRSLGFRDDIKTGFILKL